MVSTFHGINIVRRTELTNKVKSVSPKDSCPPAIQKDNLRLFPDRTLALLYFSLMQGVVPRAFKEAVIIPLQKQIGMDPLQLHNYRPISLLPYSDKLLEAHVAKLLCAFIEETNFSRSPPPTKQVFGPPTRPN